MTNVPATGQFGLPLVFDGGSRRDFLRRHQQQRFSISTAANIKAYGSQSSIRSPRPRHAQYPAWEFPKLSARARGGSARKVLAKCCMEVAGQWSAVLLAPSGRQLRWILSMTPFKYAVAVLVAVSLYAGPFLFYPLPTLAYWLIWILVACSITLLFFSLGALFRRDAKAVAIFSVTWMLTVLPFLDLEPVVRFRGWLLIEGFRIHVSPVEGYLSSCEITHFVEKRIKQAVGQCEYRPFWDAFVYHIRVRLGIALPIFRGSGWNDACGAILRSVVNATRAEFLFGNFYQLALP